MSLLQYAIVIASSDSTYDCKLTNVSACLHGLSTRACLLVFLGKYTLQIFKANLIVYIFYSLPQEMAMKWLQAI